MMRIKSAWVGSVMVVMVTMGPVSGFAQAGATTGGEVSKPSLALRSPEAKAVAAVIAAHREHLRALRTKLEAAPDAGQAEQIRQDIKTAKAGLEVRMAQIRLPFALAEGRFDDAAGLQAILSRLQEQAVPQSPAGVKHTADTQTDSTEKGAR